jgi:hypothetical protein
MEEESVEFLEWHMEHSFTELCEKYVVKDIGWMDYGEVRRAYAILLRTNIVLLFPPFLESE